MGLGGHVIGLITIVPASAGVDTAAQTAKLLSDDSGACKGKFASGSMPDEGDSKKGGEARIFTACEGTNGFYNFYQIIPRKNGGFYVIGTAATGDAAPAREIDREIQSAVFRIMDN